MKRPSLRSALSAVAAGTILLYGGWGGEYSVADLWRLERRQQEERAAAAAVSARTAELRHSVEQVQSDPAALERMARERFGMIRPGEVLVRFVAADRPPPGAVSP